LFAGKFGKQKLSKYITEVALTTGMLLISAHILDPLQQLRLFRQWDQEMDIELDDEASYTTKYQEGILKYVENEK
jgi:hypothetical protein